MQYQIRTKVTERMDQGPIENIDSGEWMVIPKPQIQFHKGRALHVKCKVFLPHQEVETRLDYDQQFLKELLMHRVTLSAKSDPHITSRRVPSLKLDDIFRANKRGSPNIEEQSSVILQGLSHQQKRGHEVYEVKMTNHNTSEAYQGVYQCMLDRQEHERQWVISQVTMAGTPSPFPAQPMVDLVACNPEDYTYNRIKRMYILTLYEAKHTCVRCRGFAHPRPSVALYHKGRGQSSYKDVLQGGNIYVNKYINVADAGAAEATYIFRNPSTQLVGSYECKAFNDRSSANLIFEIEFKSKRRKL